MCFEANVFRASAIQKGSKRMLWEQTPDAAAGRTSEEEFFEKSGTKAE